MRASTPPSPGRRASRSARRPRPRRALCPGVSQSATGREPRRQHAARGGAPPRIPIAAPAISSRQHARAPAPRTTSRPRPLVRSPRSVMPPLSPGRGSGGASTGARSGGRSAVDDVDGLRAAHRPSPARGSRPGGRARRPVARAAGSDSGRRGVGRRIGRFEADRPPGRCFGPGTSSFVARRSSFWASVLVPARCAAQKPILGQAFWRNKPWPHRRSKRRQRREHPARVGLPPRCAVAKPAPAEAASAAALSETAVARATIPSRAPPPRPRRGRAVRGEKKATTSIRPSASSARASAGSGAARLVVDLRRPRRHAPAAASRAGEIARPRAARGRAARRRRPGGARPRRAPRASATSPPAERAAKPAGRAAAAVMSPTHQAGRRALGRCGAANCSTPLAEVKTSPCSPSRSSVGRDRRRSPAAARRPSGSGPGSAFGQHRGEGLATAPRGRVQEQGPGAAMAALAAPRAPPLHGSRAGVTCGPRPAQSPEGAA